MSLGENSLVAAYQGKGQLKSRPSGTRVVTTYILYICIYIYIYITRRISDLNEDIKSLGLSLKGAMYSYLTMTEGNGDNLLTPMPAI